MPTYVALLRGIAPMNPKMKNAELKKVFERLGLENVTTVISSGNLIFESPERSSAKLETQIEEALHDHLGAPCSTIVRSRGQIEAMASLAVFDDYDDGPAQRCNVSFLKRKPRGGPSLPATTDDGSSSMLALRDQAVFGVVDTTRSKTPDFMNWVEKHYGKEVTTRTWKTVHRINKALQSRRALP